MKKTVGNQVKARFEEFEPSGIPKMYPKPCEKNHSGNKTLHRIVGGWWECAGCGQLYRSGYHPEWMPIDKAQAIIDAAEGYSES